MIRLAVRCAAEDADAVLGMLLELAPNGVEEERSGDRVEYAIYGSPGELPDLGGLTAAVGGARVEVRSAAVPDDWADRWADFHQPIVVADRLRVRPSWLASEGSAIEVVIDPGRAFGTGAHATTRLCLELLVELADSGQAAGPMSDWGTGSGVLGIAAARLGWGPILACDREPASLEAAAANASVNGVELELSRVDIRESAPPSAPTAVANLTAPLLAEAARWIGRAESAPEVLVCSGLLQAEADEVSGRFGELGLRERERRSEGDWAALLLRSDTGSG
jgi:ribosomal protein L11 methyltransferase